MQKRRSEGCENIASIVVDAENTVYDSRENCNAIIETATATLIVGCKNSTVPEGISYIGNKAFCSTGSLSSVVIPASVTSLGEYVFEYSGITSAVLPECLTTIPSGLFNLCSNLTEVTIPTSVTTIGPYAF